MNNYSLMYLVGLLLSWLLFYKLFKSKKSSFPKIKSTIIVLLFSSIIYQFSTNFYNFINRNLFGTDETVVTSTDTVKK